MREMTRRSRLLRATQTRSEALLWSALRGRRLAGTKWRRQQKMGRLIVDFFCAELRLVIEVDGAVHQGREAFDASRQESLELSGLRVLRVSADEMETDLEGVLHRLRSVIGQSSAPDRQAQPLSLLGRGAAGDASAAGGEGRGGRAGSR